MGRASKLRAHRAVLRSLQDVRPIDPEVTAAQLRAISARPRALRVLEPAAPAPAERPAPSRAASEADTYTARLARKNGRPG